MSHLAPCPACNRHIEVVETTCPFCAAALAESFRGQPGPAPPPRRLSRSAMMAAGATLMGACSANDAIGSKTDAAQDRPVATQDSHFTPVPAYGISLPPGTGGTLGSGGSVGAGGTGTATDAGKDGPAPDAAPARDAAPDRSVIAIYGAAFAGNKSPEP
jgi:hypothetical protein